MERDFQDDLGYGIGDGFEFDSAEGLSDGDVLDEPSTSVVVSAPVVRNVRNDGDDEDKSSEGWRTDSGEDVDDGNALFSPLLDTTHANELAFSQMSSSNQIRTQIVPPQPPPPLPSAIAVENEDSVGLGSETETITDVDESTQNYGLSDGDDSENDSEEDFIDDQQVTETNLKPPPPLPSIKNKNDNDGQLPDYIYADSDELFDIYAPTRTVSTNSTPVVPNSNDEDVILPPRPEEVQQMFADLRGANSTSKSSESDTSQKYSSQAHKKRKISNDTSNNQRQQILFIYPPNPYRHIPNPQKTILYEDFKKKIRDNYFKELEEQQKEEEEEDDDDDIISLESKKQLSTPQQQQQQPNYYPIFRNTKNKVLESLIYRDETKEKYDDDKKRDPDFVIISSDDELEEEEEEEIEVEEEEEEEEEEEKPRKKKKRRARRRRRRKKKKKATTTRRRRKEEEEEEDEENNEVIISTDLKNYSTTRMTENCDLHIKIRLNYGSFIVNPQLKPKSGHLVFLPMLNPGKKYTNPTEYEGIHQSILPAHWRSVGDHLIRPINPSIYTQTSKAIKIFEDLCSRSTFIKPLRGVSIKDIKHVPNRLGPILEYCHIIDPSRQRREELARFDPFFNRLLNPNCVLFYYGCSLYWKVGSHEELFFDGHSSVRIHAEVYSSLYPTIEGLFVEKMMYDSNVTSFICHSNINCNRKQNESSKDFITRMKKMKKTSEDYGIYGGFNFEKMGSLISTNIRTSDFASITPYYKLTIHSLLPKMSSWKLVKSNTFLMNVVGERQRVVCKGQCYVRIMNGQIVISKSATKYIPARKPYNVKQRSKKKIYEILQHQELRSFLFTEMKKQNVLFDQIIQLSTAISSQFRKFLRNEFESSNDQKKTPIKRKRATVVKSPEVLFKVLKEVYDHSIRSTKGLAVLSFRLLKSTFRTSTKHQPGHHFRLRNGELQFGRGNTFEDCYWNRNNGVYPNLKDVLSKFVMVPKHVHLMISQGIEASHLKGNVTEECLKFCVEKVGMTNDEVDICTDNNITGVKRKR